MREAQDRTLDHTEELSGFEVTIGDPDVRGWEVVGHHGEKMGTVDDLLVETGGRRRFLRVRTGGRTDGADAPPEEVPARSVGEALVRDSLLEVENQTTAGTHPGWSRLVLLPFDPAHLDTAARRVRLA